MAQQVIVLGGGLAGMSAAHSVVQAGGRVLVLDKSPFCGGNSTKATSGINAAGTSSQVCAYRFVFVTMRVHQKQRLSDGFCGQPIYFCVFLLEPALRHQPAYSALV